MRVFVVIITFLITSLASGQNLIPEQNLGKAKLQLSGFAQGTFKENSEPDEWDFANFRIKSQLKFSNWGLFSETNLAHCNEEKANWLKKAYLWYNFNEDWQVRMGRLLLSGAYIVPSPEKLETVVHPISRPFADYAWAMQVAGKLKRDWSIRIGLTGKSGDYFGSSESFERFEFSGRLKKSFEKWFVGLATQNSDDFYRGAVDGGWVPIKQIYLRGHIAYADNRDKKDHFGSSLLGVYKPIEWFEILSQIDHRHLVKSDTILTNGIRLIGKNDQFSFTIHYESVLNGERDNRLLGRVQFRF